ncbi:interferon-induced very large GTPase 1-like isoform X2 [Onychostoma macrolepis]|uniref:interferon-induced very large GTPase 1-like isoform X2 n=1 Tax=Onychostoma macrolepis TaxID=369639 RepID=UPI00272C6EF5|nr:interferon-induced very large GTPase 1-like isoform X2 [Onychostoma macrolepis]
MVPEVAEEKKAAQQSPLPAKTWKQTPLTILLTVTVFAVVVDMAGTTRVAEAVVGAAAGVGILQLLWEEEVRTGAVAVAGSIVGTAAAILRSLAGSQSLTASAVAGATAAAAIVAAAETQIQWVIDKIHCAISKLQWAVPIVKSTEVAKDALHTATGSGESQSATTGGALQARPAVSEGMTELFGGSLGAGSESAAFGRQAARVTNESPKTDGSLQTDESPQTDRSPEINESPKTERSLQTDESPKTDGSPQINESPQTDRSLQANESPQTDRSPQINESPKTDRSPQINESPQTDRSLQANESLQTDRSPQINESPKTDRSPEINESPQTDRSPEINKSPETDRSPEINESPQTDRSPEINESPQKDRSPQINESPQTDRSPQINESPKTDRSPQINESPQKDRSPQINESPQTDRSPQINESPQTDRSLQANESPQTDRSPQINESPKTDRSPQINESPQTDRSPEINESPQTDRSPEINESPQTDRSPEINESPKTERSLQTDESDKTNGSPQADESPLMTDLPEIANMSITGNSIPEKMIKDSESNDSAKRKSKAIGTEGTGKDKKKQQEENQREKNEHLFHRLHLQENNKLRAADVLQITAHSLSRESCAEEKLFQTFLQKLLMMDYRARYINETNEQHHTQQRHTDSFKLNGDIFKAMSLSNKGTSQSERIHPIDVQMAVFHCADGFLKQLIVTKLSQCQYALPLLVPDPFTQQIEFPLWTFRQINKSWKMRNKNNEIISQTQPIYKAETPMVFFFIFGSVSTSKSHLMNNLINEKHNTFFHRNCPGSSRTRVLMDGLVEIAWFCPSGKYTDRFTDCVAFCNLHGDAGDHEKQLQILTEMASVNVVLLPQLDSNDRSAAIIQKLYMRSKPLICLFTEDESTLIEIEKGKFKIGLKYRNQSDVSEELRIAINDCLLEPSSAFRLEDVSKYSDIIVDEEHDDDCRRGREAAQQMMRLLENKDLTKIKESFLPCQGKLWHQWCQKNKELHRPQAHETETDISRKHTELKEIRKQQYKSDISEFMNLFVKGVDSHVEEEKMFFLKWLRILLDEHTSADLSALHQKYNKTWSTFVELKDLKDNDTTEQLDAKQAELEQISEKLQAATFGLEHIMREIGQIYESSFVKNEEKKKNLQFHFSSLPSLAAQMMISGFPLELMDGDAAHVPVIWISAVLDELIQKLGDQRVFVLSVLGIQSSGKSTMLNAMFGLQFAVSAGRCTRGAFMQLVKVSEDMKKQLNSESDKMKNQMNFDYILVVDTEGLRSLELAGKSTRRHDNELATFVVGLGNLTLINIFGENPSEMQDTLQIVVQAFLRMRKVRLNPSCVFVHQNVSDVTAGEKNMDGKRRLQETLDEMTKLAAKDEVCDAECFSDVIAFDVQKDVKYFAQLWEGSPPMAPPNPNYCENIHELKESIMSHASKSQRMMLKDLKDRIKDLWEALLNERFVFSFRNSLEISAYKKLETKYSKWSWSLRSAMMETEHKQHNKIENEEIHEIKETDLQKELKTTSEEVKQSMSEFFEKDRDKDILIHWKTSFEIKIKELQENIVRETKKKLNEILQQRDLKKKIDAQKTHHENTIYEKSKELALKLKDKTNDKETLKKEFDLFWEQSVKKIVRDTPPIKDINVMRDVKLLLSDIYKSVSVDHWGEKRNVFIVQSYNDYVKLKKNSGITGALTNIYRSTKEKLGCSLSREDEAQIRSLITDVALQTDNMIQLFNISKMGYNNNCIQQLTDYIKAKLIQHEEGQVKYVFKNEFFRDLVLSICNNAIKTFTDQHRLFRDVNDPEIYVEKKREEYYSIFQKHIHGATSAAIFGEIICQKLKEPIEQSVYKKTARDLAGEMRSNCESLNGNRSKLEKHILKRLAEEEDFDKYMVYIKTPRDNFKSFIRDEVSRYITDKFSVSVLPKMKENIELLQQKIIKATHESTEHVQVNKGDVGMWLKNFRQRLSDELIFSEKHLSGVKHEDVDDFNVLEDVIRQELPAIMTEIVNRFNTKIFDEKLDVKLRPDELLTDHFCQCCWVQCPFCKAICTNSIENHDGDHSVPFHRVDGINGWHYRMTEHLSADFCTTLVTSEKRFWVSDESFPYKEYRNAKGVFAKWSISPDLSELPYWKWFVCTFQKQLEKQYNKMFQGSGKIPDEWKDYKIQNAIESLDKLFS